MKRKTAAQTSDELQDELEVALRNPREVFGYARYGNGAKWARLDKATGGLQENTWAVVASRPKIGKSMLVSDWIPHVAYQAMLAGEVVRIISLEMTRKAYQRRMAALMAGIKDPKNIRRGFLTEEEQDRYRMALRTLSDLPIEYLSNEKDLTEKEAMLPGNSGITLKDVRSFVRARDAEPTFWWVLDHIGLLNDVDRYGDVTTSLLVLANKLKDLAHVEAAGLTIAHLNRMSTGSTRPGLSAIGGSDQIVKNADQIFILKRPYFEDENPSEEDLEFVKGAGGEPAYLHFTSRDEGSEVIPLWWQTDYAAFEEYPEGVVVPMPATKRKR